MEPSQSFWDGIGKSLEHASGEIVMGMVVAIAVIFVFVKYYIPLRVEKQKHDIELDEKRWEFEQSRMAREDENEAKRVEMLSQQTEISVNQTEMLRSIQTQNQTLITQNEVIKSQLMDSKKNSSSMIDSVTSIQGDVADISTKVSYIYDKERRDQEDEEWRKKDGRS